MVHQYKDGLGMVYGMGHLGTHDYFHPHNIHFIFRKFLSDGSLSIFGRCRNGKLYGHCWKFLSGGGALFGPVDCDGDLSGEGYRNYLKIGSWSDIR